MRRKLIPGSASIRQILYAQGFRFRTFCKWSRFSFSNSKQLPSVNSSYLRLQIYTSKRFDLGCSAKPIAAPAEEDAFLELKKLMKKGLLKRKDVDKVLLNRASYGDQGNSLLVLTCISKLPDISPENRVALSEGFLAKVKSVNGAVTEAHCLQVLECYLQSKYFDNLDSFLSTMKNYGVNHSNEIKLMVFKCLSEKGMKKKDLALAQELENSCFEKNEEFYAAKIYNLAVSGGIKEALEEIKQMKGNNIEIGSNIYTSLLKAVVLKGDKYFIEELTRDVLLQGIVFSGDQILEILENIALSEHYNLISDVKLLCVEEVLLRTSRIVLIKLLHSNKVESAYDFMNYLFSLDCICDPEEKEFFFNGICKSFIEESCEIDCSVNDIIKKSQQLKKLKQCPYSVEYALYCCLRKADIRKALAILQVMFNEYSMEPWKYSLEPHYFWPLLITFKEKFRDEGIIFVLGKMAELQVPFNPETLMDYVFPNMSHLYFAKDILERVNMLEAQQELFTEVFLLYAIKHRHFKECLEFMTEYTDRRDRMYSYLENYLLEALLENPNCEEIVVLAKKTNAVDPFLVISKLWSRNDIKEISQLSRYFKKHNMFTRKVEEAKAFIKINKDKRLIKKAVSQLINERAIEAETGSDSSKIKKPSRFEELILLENAEIILSELKAKNLNTTGQRLRVMKMYMQNQMYDKAVRAKKEVLELLGENPDFSTGYLIMLARLSAYEGDTEGAIRYFNILKEKYPRFIVGTVTGLSLCLHFMQNDCYEEMLSVLRILPKWEGKLENLSSRPVQVLREVARLGTPELTDLVFKIMLQKKYIGVNVNALQVYTKTYLYANDLEGAVIEYERIAEEHGIVCNTTSILWSAIQAGRLDLAERVTRLCLTKNKSKYSVVSILVMIASTGNVEILTSYSEKLGLSLDDDLMIQKFVEGKIPSCPSSAFKTLIEAALKMGWSYHHFVEGAVKSMIKGKDHEGAKDFLNFCESNKITLGEDQVSKIRVHLELCEIDAASKNINI